MTDRFSVLPAWIRGLRAFVPLLMLCCFLPLGAAAADITTADGRRFHDCEVLKADTLGIYFRHSRGIARVLYEDLSADLLARLEPLPEIEEFGKGLDRFEAEGGKGASAVPAAGGPTEFRVVFRQRVVIGVPRGICEPLYSNCGLAAGPLRLARYPCRRMAERDFLITSGILPRPPGVVTRQLPRGWRFYY